MRVKERLVSELIARGEETIALAVPDEDDEDPTQPPNGLLTPASVSLQHQPGIAFRDGLQPQLTCELLTLVQHAPNATFSPPPAAVLARGS